jgi:hypothetical protein
MARNLSGKAEVEDKVEAKRRFKVRGFLDLNLSLNPCISERQIDV